MNEDEKLEFLDTAKKRWKSISDVEAAARALMLDDWQFYHDNYYDQNSNQDDDMPQIAVPRINQFVHQVTNDQRQNKPTFKISPTGAESSDIQEKRVKAADIRAGLVKSIVYHSQGENAIQHAFDHAVIMGRGFYRVDTEYENPRSNDQDIVINKVENPLSVYMDTDRTKLDYSDCKFGFVLSKMKKDAFKEKYPKADFTDWNTSDHEEFWVTEDEITVAEYYQMKEKEDILYTLDDNSKVLKSEVKDEDFDESKVVTQRDTIVPQLQFCILTSLEVVGDIIDLPGDRIPLFPIIGEEEKIGQTLIIKGLLRGSKDSQKMYNYWTSKEAQWLASSTISQYIVEESQIEGYEDIWSKGNVSSYSVLPYKASNPGGQALPAPQKTPPPSIPAGYIQGKMGCIDDMKATTGIYDEGLGQKGNTVSGKAIIARQREQDTSNFHFTDNERISITSSGQYIIDIMPTYYDTNRIIKILGEDDSEDTIELMGEDDKGEKITLGDGYYSCQVSMGPSFSTQRQEASESMLEFMQVYPDSAPLIGDLIAGNMDWHNSDKVAQRLKTLLPPGVMESDEDDENNPIVMQLQQAMKQMQGQLQEAGQMIQKYEMEKGNEQGKLQIEAEKVQVDQFKADTDRMKAQVEAQKADAEIANMAKQAPPQEGASSDAQIRAETEIVKTQLNIEAEAEKQRKELNKEENTINNGQLIREQITEKMDENLEKLATIVIESAEEIKKKEPKETIVKKTNENEYQAVTTDQEGNETVAIVTKVKDGYKIEDK